MSAWRLSDMASPHVMSPSTALRPQLGQGRGVLGGPHLVREPGLFLLEVGGVGEEDLEQACGRRCDERRAREALAHQAGQEPGVIDVRVGENDGIEGARFHLEGLPVSQPQLLVALEHPCVNEDAVASVLEQVAGARDRAGCTEKGEGRHQGILLPRPRPGAAKESQLRVRWQWRPPREVAAPACRGVARGGVGF